MSTKKTAQDGAAPPSDTDTANAGASPAASPPAATPPADEAPPVKARVLVQCTYGQPNDVASVPAAQVDQAKADGLVDTTPEAVAYAESLRADAEQAAL